LHARAGRRRPFYAAIVAGLACALLIGKALPVMMDAVSTVIAPLEALTRFAAQIDLSPDAER
jgi:hypothetical protein